MTPIRRVQRPTDELPLVHLESEIPTVERWSIAVRGLVGRPHTFSLHDIRAMPTAERVWDLHCVWGWTRPACRWEGVLAAELIDLAGPLPNAAHVVAHAMSSPYASCLELAEARESLIAWRLDGAELSPEHGGPLRLVPPPTKWGYKGVKWVGALELLERFTPGFWEEAVGDPRGDVPPEMLDLTHE